MIRNLINFLPIHPKHALKLVNFYPPFIGAGIRVTSVADDFSTIEVEMKLNRMNRNYVGTHFGGSLYAMCDPFFMFILLEKLGKNFLVWDKSATIHFLRPGRSTVKASFHVTEEELAQIIEQTKDGHKFEPKFHTSIWDDQGQEVARVDKILWVKKKS